jgi:hypothetical protein
MTDVRLDRNAHEYADPSSVAFWLNISPPSVETNAQIKMATHAVGTIIDLAMNSHRRLFGCMHKKGSEMSQKMKKLIIVLVSMPWDSGMSLRSVRNDGQMAPIMTRTLFAPFMFWIANQKIASTARDTMAMYEPQNPHEARASTGKGAWWITPMAPLSAMTNEMMKNASATIPRDSRQVRPGDGVRTTPVVNSRHETYRRQ